MELEQYGVTDVDGKTSDVQVDKKGVVEVKVIDKPSSTKPFSVSKRRIALKAVGEGGVTLVGKG